MPELTPYSVEWWIWALEAKLSKRQRDLKNYDDYYSGNQNIKFQSENFRKEFADLLRGLSDNWCQLVVEAVHERIAVVGFRWGEDAPADRDAWEIWQYNRMDAESLILQRETLINAEAYTMVNPFVGDNLMPEITVEHPTEMVVATEPGNRWRREAAFKKWQDEWGHWFATLYLPNAIYKLQHRRKGLELSDEARVWGSWVQRNVADEAWPLVNPLNDIPVIPFQNLSRMVKQPQSELENVIPNQDAINKLVADLMIASENMGFPQRTATGIKVEKDPNTGEPIKPIRAGTDKMLASEAKDARFGSLPAADLTNIVAAIENRVQSTASQSRTPPHYFYLKGEFPSGESVKSAEASLVSKALEKRVFWGESYEDTKRMAFKARWLKTGADEDLRRASDFTAETIWKDAETRTESQMADAALKLKELNIADEIQWERIGLTPKQIRRNKALLAQQQLEASLLAPSEPASATN